MPHRIAIIGAGFSGTVLAAHLLRQSPNTATQVVLVERAAVMGRGVAYATRDWPYLLNVPAGRLSADSRDPLQFLRFAQRIRPGTDAEDFLSREMYGDYLEDVLLRAEQQSSAQIRLTRISGEVCRLARARATDEFELHMLRDAPIVVDRVVLATGNPPSGDMPWSIGAREHSAYRADPWTSPKGLGPDKTVVIVGSGLTMADLAVSLAADPERAPKLVSISRHGLMPLPQSRFSAPTQNATASAALAGANSARQLLSVVRALAREGLAGGGDWREVITSVRNAAPRLWQSLAVVERQRFLRHLRSYWDVHRHRIPPEMAARLELIRGAGKLRVHAGRILSVEPRGDGLTVTWRTRARQQTRRLEADLVVNATGPETSLKSSPDPLLRSLWETGWIAADDLGLGLNTAAENGACIDSNGRVSEQLFYLGPMLRATHWEATAATELRDHAERLAACLLDESSSMSL